MHEEQPCRAEAVVTSELSERADPVELDRSRTIDDCRLVRPSSYRAIAHRPVASRLVIALATSHRRRRLARYAG